MGMKAQTTYNVPADSTLNEFIANNFDENGLSTYVLERDGFYELSGSMNFSGDIAIVAEEGQGMRPIILMGVNDEGEPNGWGLMWTDGSVTFRSLRVNISNITGGRGAWSNAGVFTTASNATIEFDDCIVDYSDGVMISNESGTGIELILTDNLIRWSGVDNGGRWQGFGTILKNGSLEKAYIENNTFVECYAPVFLHENGHLKKVWFNHNTIVSHAQLPIRGEYWDKAVFMNNLFVDAHFGGETVDARKGQDPDGLPYGILNIAQYKVDSLIPETFPQDETQRVIAMAYNANYVSSEIKQFWSNSSQYFHDTLDYQVADYTKGDNGFLNARSDSMMKSLGDYNYPNFKYDENLSVFTTNPEFKNYSVKTDEMIKIARQMNGDTSVTVPTDNGTWSRYPGPSDEHAAYPVARDYWDFSYNNSTLAKSGHRGYPVGDLNWWPQKKADWEADSNKESFEEIVTAVEAGTFEFVDWANTVDVIETKSMDAALGSVFPNPASGEANVTINLKSSGKTSLKIFNLYGQEVLSVLEEQLPAGMHRTSFNVANLPSGTYILSLSSDNHSSVGKFTVQ
jgi:hypothetical protein